MTEESGTRIEKIETPKHTRRRCLKSERGGKKKKET
jgi:hypothetical protein